jgi:Mor family transcriptional regulator
MSEYTRTNWPSTVDPARNREICRRVAKGETTAEVAHRYGMTTQSIRRIVTAAAAITKARETPPDTVAPTPTTRSTPPAAAR